MFPKVVCLVVFLFLAEQTFASCIQYGHACWGGHGKRGNALSAEKDKTETLDLKPLVSKEWFLSRLVTPAEAQMLTKEAFNGGEQEEERTSKAKDEIYKLLQASGDYQQNQEH